MRLAGTAIICVVAAFGAAFLVARAVNHESPARAATPPKTTNVADTTTRVTPKHKVNVELVSQFAPIRGSKLKPRPKPHRKHKKPKPTVSVTQSAPSTVTSSQTYTTPPQSYTQPVQSAPTQSAPTHSGGSTHHKTSGSSSGGSGTTTIGG